MKRTLACLALVLCATAQAKGPATVYVGTVAGQDVVVRNLDAFAYLRFGHQLSLQKRGPDLYAECPAEGSRDSDCAEPSGWWTLHADGDRLAGTWQKTRGAALRPIALQSSTRSYDEVVLGANRIVVGKATRTGPVTWAMKKEQRSEVALPVLLSGPDAAALARINATMAKRFDEAVLEALSSVDYEPDEKVLYADDRVVAIGGLTAYDGGGAHPSDFFAALTWDLRTGEPVDWEALMRPAPAGPVSLAPRDVFLSSVLRALVRRADTADAECLQDAVQLMKCSDTSCADVPRSRGKTGWAIYPMRTGLAVATDVYPESGRGCRGETVTVPWREVRGALKAPSELLPP